MDTSSSTPRLRSVHEPTSGSTTDPTPPGSWPDVHPDNNDRLSSSASIPGSELATGTTGDPQSQSQDQPQPQPQSEQGPQGQQEPRRRRSAWVPHRGRYEPNNPNYRLTRGQLRDIASITLGKLDLGFYVPPPFKTKAEVEAEAKLKAEAQAEEKAKWEARIREEEEESNQNNAQPSVKNQDQDGRGDDGNKAEQDRLQELDEEKTKVGEENQQPPIYSSAYDLSSKIQYTDAHTEFYAPDDPYISNWSAIARPDATASAEESTGDDNVKPSRPPRTQSAKTKTRILIREYSTNVGARRMHDLLRRKRGKDKDRVKDDENDVSPSTPHGQTNTIQTEDENNDKIGVLNFASAKKPGGGFINGSQAQEESLARTSTLYPSLITPTAAPFYEHYHANPDSPTAAYYTHAMVYSPSVVLFRNDKGLWMSPIEVDILTSAAVNAGEVRERVKWEKEVREVRERWEKAEEEKRVWEEEAKKREEEEWAAILKENEEMKKWFGDGDGDGDKVGEEKDVGKKEDEKLEETVGSTTQEIKDDLISGALPGYSDTLSTSSIDHQSSEKSTPATLLVLETDSKTTPLDAIPSASQHAEAEVEDQATVPEPAEPPSEPKPDPMALAELEIEAQMYERIARILALFASPSPSSSASSSSPTSDRTTSKPRTPHLILGSFGTGVFQNNITLVARIFYDLLAQRGAPFAGVFQTVVFAILGTGTVNIFREVFAGRGDVSAATGGSAKAEDKITLDTDRNAIDGCVEIIKEGEDEDETALEQEEEAGCEEEGVLEPVEAETIPEHDLDRADEANVDGKGDAIVVDVDNIAEKSTVRGEEVEMLDGTHGDVNSDADVEMIYSAEDVHLHPQELVEET